MEHSEIIISIVGVLSTVVSAVISYLLTKRKYNSEVDRNLIENMESSLAFYQKLSDDNQERLEKLAERNSALEIEVLELRKLLLDLSISICTDLACNVRKSDTVSLKQMLDNKDED